MKRLPGRAGQAPRDVAAARLYGTQSDQLRAPTEGRFDGPGYTRSKATKRAKGIGPMAKIRVGINGFGRIGRNFLRAQLERGGDFEVVAANDIGDTKTMAHLLKHDSVLGTLDLPVEAGDGFVRAGDHKIEFVSVKDPAQLPWRDLEIDIAIESTGLFTDRESAQKHLEAGARKVVLSAPATHH